jgi:hypothetical protein
MSNCPQGKRFKPLPLRRGFWRELPKKLKAGVVLLTENTPEGEDIRTAAQSILISIIESRLMGEFKRPALKPGREFYAEFLAVYQDHIQAEEFRIWEELGCEIDQSLAKQPNRDLTEVEAAYLTYTMLRTETVLLEQEPPQSNELYMNLAVYARAYEELLREKYKGQHTPELLYKALREHMPNFLFRLIGMDSVLSILLTMNAIPKELAGEKILLHERTVIEPRFMELGADDSFSFRPKFLEMVCDLARRQNFTEDSLGRTEDRGCPVLYATERDAIIRFSIEELIAQHASHEHKP